MNALLDGLASALAKVASWVFLAGVLATGYEIVARYGFNAPTIWAHETTTFLAGVGFLLGGFYAANRRAQIAIGSVYSLLSPRWRRRLDVANAVLSFLCFAVLTYACFGPAWTKLVRWETTGTAWDPPIPALIMPLLWLSILLLALQALFDLVQILRGSAAGNE